ncbi:MAG: hypothetical protein QXN55_00070 [Candidatus Nitrosotenuis sp.]
MSNVFNVTEFPDNHIKPRFDVQVVKVYYMQHANGDRSNLRRYSFVDEYINDPLNKDLYQEKLNSNIFSFCCGDPESVDAIYVIKFGVTDFTLTGTICDVVPNEWYLENHADTAARLAKVIPYDTAH